MVGLFLEGKDNSFAIGRNLCGLSFCPNSWIFVRILDFFPGDANLTDWKLLRIRALGLKGHFPPLVYILPLYSFGLICLDYEQ